MKSEISLKLQVKKKHKKPSGIWGILLLSSRSLKNPSIKKTSIQCAFKKNMKNKTVQKSFATLIGLSIALLIPVLLLYGYVSVGAITYSDGTRSGVVVKVSTKGVFIKTTEGEMNYGGSLDVGGVPKVFEFSVVDPKIKDDLIDAEKQGRRCTLHYKQQLLKQFWKGQTSYFITKVEFLER